MNLRVSSYRLLRSDCRAAGVPFHVALHDDLFGFEPGRVHSELAEWELASAPPPAAHPDLYHRTAAGIELAIRDAGFGHDIEIRAEDRRAMSLGWAT